MTAGWNDFQFEHPVVKVIDALFAYQSHQAAFGGFLAGCGDIPTRKIGRTNIDHFPLLDQSIKSLPGLIPRAIVINVVHLVQVNPLSLQPGQTPLTMFSYLVSTQAASITVDFRQVSFPVHRVVDLRR